MVEPIQLPAETQDIQRCLDVLTDGFNQVRAQLSTEPVAISFAFPGPADYVHGVIGDLPNFPCFRGGIALGPYLQAKFGIPVYINNDGNLFAYGEALTGSLYQINQELEAAGSYKRYRNLLGITLGTGFGGGVVIDSILLTGDNGCGGDVWCMRNQKYPNLIAEESVSKRAVTRVYGELTGQDTTLMTPKDIFDIAEGLVPGNQEAAKRSFFELGEVAGAAIANSLMIVDGLVVFGGGVARAHKYILPGVMQALRQPLGTFGGAQFPCLQMSVYNLMDEEDKNTFMEDHHQTVTIPGTQTQVSYDVDRKIGVTVSTLGASKAIQLGAYAFALAQLDK